MDGGREEIVVAAAEVPAITMPDEGESCCASRSTSDVLSKALDILDISAVTNEKPRTSRPRASPPITARKNPQSANDKHIVISFPTCAKVTMTHNVSAVSTTAERRPKLTRLGSVESISTAATISTSASFEVSPLPSPTGSPVASPKRSIFQSYWERPKETPKKHKEQHQAHPDTTTRFSFSNVPKATELSTSGQDLLPSTIDGGTADVSSASAAYTAAFKSSTNLIVPSTNAAGSKASPKRSIFGDRAMETAQRSSLPDLPSVAATFISETRTRQVHKTASTGQLIKVRKSCLRRTALYSSSSLTSHGRGQMKKSASTTTATCATTAKGSLGRSRSESAVQFDPEVRVYEFHRTDNHHHDRRSSNEWSHIFA